LVPPLRDAFTRRKEPACANIARGASRRLLPDLMTPGRGQCNRVRRASKAWPHLAACNENGQARKLARV